MHDDGMSAERLRAGVMFDHANVAAGSPTQTEPRRTKIVRSEGVKLLQNDLFTPVHRWMAPAWQELFRRSDNWWSGCGHRSGLIEADSWSAGSNGSPRIESQPLWRA